MRLLSVLRSRLMAEMPACSGNSQGINTYNVRLQRQKFRSNPARCDRLEGASTHQRTCKIQASESKSCARCTGLHTN
jgi:hypothetical protein